MLGVGSQNRVSEWNRTHDPHANSLAHFPLDYQGTHFTHLFVMVVGKYIVTNSFMVKVINLLVDVVFLTNN